MKNWKYISTNDDVDAIIKKSTTKPQILYKDSMHCGISAQYAFQIVAWNDVVLNFSIACGNCCVPTARRNSLLGGYSTKISPHGGLNIVYRALHHTIEPKKILAGLAAE